MKTVKERMDKVKAETYEDCVWYLKDIDRCKLPGIGRRPYSKCYCQDKEMEEFCIWVTKFLKSDSPKDDEDKNIVGCWEEYNDLVFNEELGEVRRENELSEFLKRLHIIS